MQKLLINYEKLPVIQNRICGFYQIGQERTDALKQFNQVMDRIHGIMRFLYHFSPENNLVTKKAYLRAALSEFVSIEEVLINDLKENKISADVLKINATQNPLFHILKQLRNYNIHLGNSGINYSDSKRIIWGDALEYDEKFAIIDNFNLEEFNRLRDSKYFDESDKEMMIDWFNTNQKVWGVSHLVFLAALLYCDYIIQAYKLELKQ